MTGRRGLRSSTDAHVDSVAQAGFEPAASFVLSEGGLPVAYRAACLGSLCVPLFCFVPLSVLCPEQESNLHSFGFKPNRSAIGVPGQTNSKSFSLIPDGLEPSFPGCRPGVVAAGPRDRAIVKSGLTGNRTRIFGLQDRRLPVGP